MRKQVMNTAMRWTGFGLLTLLLCCNDPEGIVPGNTVMQVHPAGNDLSKGQQVLAAGDTLLVDTAAYDLIWNRLVHNRPSAKWPVKGPYPLKGGLLPFNRIVAFYGNFLSARMGILGQLPPAALAAKLREESKQWELADPETPVRPAIHYIAVTAQRAPGRDHKYRLRMSFSEIDKAIQLAATMDALVFLDLQLGHSTLQEELPALKKYLVMPGVHLGIDPEYSMKNGQVPCSTIGTMDATDINYATSYLRELVKQYHLPPKILVVHRFTKGMVTNYQRIQTIPEVQIVINMDGFGFPGKKKDSYNGWVAGQPVQFTGFKLFYKQDLLDARGKALMTPQEVLQLYPQPVYIQYQ